MLSEKIKRIQTELRLQHLDALIIGNFGHQIADDLLYYLLLKKLEYGMMYIPAKGKPTLWGISFEAAQLQKAHPEIGVKAFDTSVSNLLQKKIKNKIEFGIRGNALPHSLISELKNYRIKEFKNSHTITAIKSPEEIKILRKASDVTGGVFEGAVKHWKEFKTEIDAANFINHSFVAQGYEPSFPTIVASGKNAAHPHHVPTNTKLQKGFCVIDMGVRLNGYCSDMTRTIYIGRPSTVDRRLYQSILVAQEKTITKVKPGIAAKQLDIYCRELLGKTLSKEFVHGLGHGVGTQVHEWPSVSGRSDVILEENMLITIEPGVYRQNTYGIRIEDDVLVTKTGSRVLTRTSKELKIVT